MTRRGGPATRLRPAGRRAALLLQTILTSGIVVCLACARPASPGLAPIVLVGVDGATWSVLSPMLDQGRLPRLAVLYSAGAAGLMRSEDPMITAPAWTTVATGRPASVHGIRANAVRVAGQYLLRPVTSDLRQVPALWTIATARGVGVGVVGWPAGFPAEPVEGFFLSEAWDAATGDPPRGIHPDGAIGPEEVEPLAIPGRLGPMLSLDARLRAAYERDLGDLARALTLYRVHRPRLLVLRFRTIDDASHRAWRYLDPEAVDRMRARGEAVDPAEADRLARLIPAAYEFLDAWIGILMDRIPEGSTIVLVSNHGFRAATAEDATRFEPSLLLEHLDLLLKDEDGSPDWSRTKVFSLPSGDPRRHALWINAKGEERKGIVDPDALGSFRETLAATLRALALPDGRTLFEEVLLADETGEGSPDLWIVPREGIPPDTPVSGGARGAVPIRAGDLRVPRVSHGVHDPAGVFLAAGGGIARGRTGIEADLVDVLPTILQLAGIPVAEDLPGRAIEACLADRVPAGAARVATWSAIPAAPDTVMLPLPAAAREIEALRRASHLD